MQEHLKAKAWRERRGLSVVELAKLAGFNRVTIYGFEKGTTPERPGQKPGKISAAVWQRYKMACAGVDAQLKRNRKFDW